MYNQIIPQYVKYPKIKGESSSKILKFPQFSNTSADNVRASVPFSMSEGCLQKKLTEKYPILAEWKAF